MGAMKNPQITLNHNQFDRLEVNETESLTAENLFSISKIALNNIIRNR